MLRTALFALLGLTLGAQTLTAQLSPQSISIPMRDGQSLAADLYLPNTTDSFPVILIQTPYNKDFYQLTGLPLGIGTNLAVSPYAFVIVDWRCFYSSAAACTTNVNRGEDGYDAVEWIAQQNWSDGQIGTWGPSALGGVQFSTAYEQPPHLVCAVPEVVSPSTEFGNYYTGGALRLEYVETLGFLFGSAGMQLVIDNPYDNLLWDFAGLAFRPQDVNVPMLMVAGWYDQNLGEDFEVLDTLRQVSGAAVRDKHKMLIGPWVHGGTGQAHVGTVQQGELSFPQAENRNDSIAMDFFDFYLRGIQNGWDSRSRYSYFQMGENQWENTQEWPPSGISENSLYLDGSNGLSETAPTAANSSLSVMYDPLDPSPTIGGKTLNLALDQGPYDQRDSVESRSDALLFTTSTLQQDLRVQGKIRAELFLGSDRKDTDFMLRLTDVYPDGRSMLMAETAIRMHYRNGNSPSDTAYMNPGTVYQVELEFEDLALTFLAGHKVRLILTSSQYPRYNRNPNTGGPVHPGGNPDSLVNPVIATNSVHLDAGHPSRLIFPVAGPATAMQPTQPESESIQVFPQPAKGMLQLRGMPLGTELRLLDMQGRVLKLQRFQHSEGSLDCDDLVAGSYLMTIRSEKTGEVYRKVILFQ